MLKASIILLYLLCSSGLVQAQSKGMKPVGGDAPVGTERRLALVIGNKDYQNVSRLNNPLNDADDMATALRTLGFEVILRKNLTQSEFLRSIDEFGDRLRQYDVGLFYYSGHGVQHNGDNYLVPIDANAKTAPEIEYACVKLGRTLAKMEGANLKVSLALLDACRDSPFPAGTKSTTAKGLNIPNNPPGSFVAFSTRAGSTADGNQQGRNGLFTAELLRHLTTPNLGIRTILDRTTQGVSSRSNKSQIPGRYDELTGDFVFVETTPPIAKTEPYTPSKREEPVCTEPVKPNTTPSERPNVLGKGTKSFLDLPFADMAYVEGGTFQMGDTRNEGETDEKPVHSVTVSSFYMSKYEITQRQWESVMGSNPSYFKDCADCPVERVSWEDVQVFLGKLNVRTGGNYRLPTEAEWEYAAGGGSNNRTRFGNGKDVLDATEANFNAEVEHKKSYSITGEYRVKTVKVGSFRSNGLGLYDMTGNVLEWCSDWYGAYSSGSQSNPTGSATGSNRVFRGGSWRNYPAFSRLSYRYGTAPLYRDNDLGFRVVSFQ
ncbi:MAG: SUMF1/EgtB/PvdO family nonheme iron enzyme [Spirosomataceae bacterium]